jgi:OPA family sugar phosphate sensor protein UhpC-like MFS transporter
MRYHELRNSHYEYWRWRIFAITWLAYFGFYLTRKSFAVAKIGMGGDADLGAENYSSAQIASRADGRVGLMDVDMSWIDGGYLAAYAIGQFVWGIAGDKVGPRWVVLTGMIGSVVAAALMGASSLTIMLGVFFCIQGAFQATGWAPLAKNVGNFFAQRERGVIFGLWSTNYAVGGLVASAFAGWCGDKFGWRWAFYIPALALLVIAVLFWFCQRNRPEDVGLKPIEQYRTAQADSATPDSKGSWKETWSVITNPNVVVLSLVYFLLKPTRYAILFWGPSYVHAKLGTDMTQSGLISGQFELAGIPSTLAAGLISDRVFGARRMPICVLSLFALGIGLFFFDRLPADRISVGAGFFVLGFLLHAPDSIASGAAAADFGSKRGTSTAAGWINGWGSVGAVLGGTIKGLAEQFGWSWSEVFSFLACLSLISALLLLPKWNARPEIEVVKGHV